MKALLAVVGIAALTLSVSRASVALGDRSYLVPPPEAVCEDFLRKMAEHRFAQATDDLSATLKQDERHLGAIQAAIEASHGRVEHVQGEETRLIDDRNATARSRVRFGEGLRDVVLDLHFESGLWKVTSVDPLRRLALRSSSSR